MDDWLGLLQWPAMAISFASAYWMGSQKAKKRIVAFWLLILGNVLWIAWGWSTEAWALIGLQAGLIGLNVRGIVKNEAA